MDDCLSVCLRWVGKVSQIEVWKFGFGYTKTSPNVTWWHTFFVIFFLTGQIRVFLWFSKLARNFMSFIKTIQIYSFCPIYWILSPFQGSIWNSYSNFYIFPDLVLKVSISPTWELCFLSTNLYFISYPSNLLFYVRVWRIF